MSSPTSRSHGSERGVVPARPTTVDTRAMGKLQQGCTGFRVYDLTCDLSPTLAGAETAPISCGAGARIQFGHFPTDQQHAPGTLCRRRLLHDGTFSLPSICFSMPLTNRTVAFESTVVVGPYELSSDLGSGVFARRERKDHELRVSGELKGFDDLELVDQSIQSSCTPLSPWGLSSLRQPNSQRVEARPRLRRDSDCRRKIICSLLR